MHTQTVKTSLFVVSILTIQCSDCHAAGFGAIRVQSALGEALNITIPVIGSENSPQWYSCVKARVESLDGTLALVPKIKVLRSDRNPSIQLTTLEHINEPAMTIVVEHGCDIAVQRSYQILLDPIALLASVAEPSIPGADAASYKSSDDMLAVPNLSDADGALKSSVYRHKRHVAKLSETNASRLSEVVPLAKKTAQKRSARNVLRVSLLDEPPPIAPVAATPAPESLPLVLAPVSTPSSTSKTASVFAGQGIALSEMSNSTQLQIMHSLQLEIDALRSENLRITQQGNSDKNSLQSLRNELFIWIKSLGLILLLCLFAFAWLIKRFFALKNESNRPAWYPQVATDESKFARPTKSAVEVDAYRPRVPVAAPATASENASNERVEGYAAFLARKINSGEQSAESASLRPEDAANDSDDLMDFERPLAHSGAFKAEEISDIMELVGAWMALHKPVEVLELLEPFNQIEAPESPLPWLCLLDVYNNINDQAKYEAIGDRIVSLFNVHVAPWEQRTKYGGVTLANFPRIVDKILAIWDSDELPIYIHSLLVNDRVGTRAGFDLSLYRDLSKLESVARDPLRPRKIEELRKIKACSVLFANLTSDTGQDFVTDPVQNQSSLTPAQSVTDGSSLYQYGGRYDGFSNDRYAEQKYHSGNGSPGVTEELAMDEAKLSIPDNAGNGLNGRLKEEISFASTQLSAARDLTQVSGAGLNKQYEVSSGAQIMSPMAVKLNLGIAYQDIGDFEGATLLMEEIIKEGTPEQAELAKLLLSPKRVKDAG